MIFTKSFFSPILMQGHPHKLIGQELSAMAKLGQSLSPAHIQTDQFIVVDPASPSTSCGSTRILPKLLVKSDRIHFTDPNENALNVDSPPSQTQTTQPRVSILSLLRSFELSSVPASAALYAGDSTSFVTQTNRDNYSLAGAVDSTATQSGSAPSDEHKATTVAAWLDQMLFPSVPREKRGLGRQAVPYELLLEELTAIPFDRIHAELKEAHSGLLEKPIRVTIKSNWGGVVTGLATVSTHDLPKSRMYQFIDLEITKDGIVITDIRGMNKNLVYAPLIRNSSARFSKNIQPEAVAAWLDASVFSEIPPSETGWGKQPIERKTFLTILEKMPLASLCEELSRLRPDFFAETVEVLIRSDWPKDVSGIMFLTPQTDKATRGDQRIRLRLSSHEVLVTCVEGGLTEFSSIALLRNKSVTLSPQAKLEALAALLDHKVLGQFPKSTVTQGRPLIPRDNFLSALGSIPWDMVATELAEIYPELAENPLDMTIKLSWQKDGNVGSLALVSGNEKKPAGNYQNIKLKIFRDGITVVAVEGCNDHLTYAKLVDNPKTKFSEQSRVAAMAEWLSSKIFTHVPEAPNRVGRARITREELKKELSTIAFSKIFDDLKRLHPDLIDTPVKLALKLSWEEAEEIGYLKFVPVVDGEIATNTSQEIIWDVGKDGIKITKISGKHAASKYDNFSYTALLENPSVHFSETEEAKAVVAWLDSKFCGDIPASKNGLGREAIAIDSYLTRLSGLPLDTIFEELKKIRPALLETSRRVAIRSLWGGKGLVQAIAVVPVTADEQISGSPYQHIILDLTDDAIELNCVKGANPELMHLAWMRNPTARFASSARSAVLVDWLNDKIFGSVNKVGTTAAFAEILATLPWKDILDDLRRTRPAFLQTPLKVLIKSNWQGRKGIESLAFHAAQNSGAAMGAYQYILIELTNEKATLLAVEGNNKPIAYTALLANASLTIHPFILAQYREGQLESRLLLSLSEFGRTLLYDEIRSLLAGRGIVFSDQPVSLDDTILQEASHRILIKLSQDFALALTAGVPWPSNDRRFAVALTLSEFIFTPPENPALDELLTTAQTREHSRVLDEYNRVLRLAGDSPIAESGWDQVFSPELQVALRAFAASWFKAGTVAKPAQDFLRDPFNEVLGAYYFHVLHENENADQRLEILSHLFYQARRGDSLKAFYDGMIKASGMSADHIQAAVRQELKAFAAERGYWGLDTEEPTRLVEGLIGGAARFTWNAVLRAQEQNLVVQAARELFSQHAHEFPDDTDLSAVLPQALFFEAVGLAARHIFDQWSLSPAKPDFDQGIELLNLLTGLGDESARGFRRGFGRSLSGPDIINQLTTALIQDHDERFRAWMEEVITYPINRVLEGNYTTETVTTRRADLLSRLMAGYSLRDQALVLRRFRLNDMSEFEERNQAKAIWGKISTGSATVDDKAWLYTILDRWTAPGTGARIRGARPGERWYWIEQWITQNGTDGTGRFFDEVLAAL